MNLIGMIAAMRAAGVSEEQILATVEQVETDKLAKQRERVRRHRERKNETLVTLQGERNVGDVTKQPIPDGFLPPSTPLPSLAPLPPALSKRELPPKPNLASEFDAWWALVPRKEGKGHAEKAYRTARKLATAEQLADGITSYAERMRETEPQFIRLPATWLNGKGWLDQPQTGPPAMTADEAKRIVAETLEKSHADQRVNGRAPGAVAERVCEAGAAGLLDPELRQGLGEIQRGGFIRRMGGH